jgi:hypothetical protein
MSRLSVYLAGNGRWIVFYRNAAAQRVIVNNFGCEIEARTYAERENARLWPEAA